MTLVAPCFYRRVLENFFKYFGTRVALSRGMLMLRQGGKFTDRQVRKYLIRALLCFGIVVAAAFAMRYISVPLVGFLVLAAAIEIFKGSLNRWGNWFVGKRGELAVAKALKDLPDEYVLLNDLMLPDGRGNVDHLVIGPNGLFVIETKNYSGYVKCLGDTWYVNGRKIQSLSRQAKGNAVAVRQNLEGVFKEQRTRLPYVTPLLVFVDGKSRLSIRNPAVHVLHSSRLAKFIARYNNARPASITSPELRRGIVHHLQLLQQNPDKLLANS